MAKGIIINNKNKKRNLKNILKNFQNTKKTKNNAMCIIHGIYINLIYLYL